MTTKQRRQKTALQKNEKKRIDKLNSLKEKQQEEAYKMAEFRRQQEKNRLKRIKNARMNANRRDQAKATADEALQRKVKKLVEKDAVHRMKKKALDEERCRDKALKDEIHRLKQQEKADAIVTLLGYPDWLVDPAEVDDYFKGIRPTEATTHFENMLGVKYWASGKELHSLRETPERTIWLTQPAIVNAFYSPNHNSITFPAGILQSPFFAFGEGYPRYLNYGAIGVVIGHELTHGFDDQGRQYDGNGNALPWWSPDTVEAFTVQAQCFIDQYNNYTVDEIVDIVGADNAHVNGKNTQGENIADNGGVRESFRAYMKSIEVQGTEQRLPGLTQYTPEQMFFVSFAQVWCERITDQGLASQILTDPHSPGKFRVFGPLSNSEDFVREWNCPAGPMNRPEKCLLW